MLLMAFGEVILQLVSVFSPPVYSANQFEFKSDLNVLNYDS
jgi:hypothetical protein